MKENSSSLMTPSRGQETKQLQQFLKQTAELAERRREVMEATLTMERGARELLNVITRITPTPEEDAEVKKVCHRFSLSVSENS